MADSGVDERLSIVVVGIGPVGGVLAAALARAGHRVLVVDTDAPHIEAVRRAGITVTGVREIQGRPEMAVTAIRDLPREDHDYVVVATKASVTAKVMGDVQALLGPRTMVDSLQNGLDAEAEIARVVGPDRTLRTVVNYAGGKVADGELRMAFLTGHNHVGAATPAGVPAAERLARVLTAAGLETDFVEDIRKFEWEKTILNAAMSPLCTLTNLTMRECTESAAMMRIVELLIDEGIATAKADGYEWGADFREHCLGYLRRAGHHRASMWVDAVNRRPTEIGFLNGRIRDVAAQRGVAAPTHAAISTLVEALEQHWSSPHQEGSAKE